MITHFNSVGTMRAQGYNYRLMQERSENILHKTITYQNFSNDPNIDVACVFLDDLKVWGLYRKMEDIKMVKETNWSPRIEFLIERGLVRREGKFEIHWTKIGKMYLKELPKCKYNWRMALNRVRR